MASTRKLNTKDGRVLYEIIVSRGRGKSQLTTRWYPPEGWSQKTIDRELEKIKADFERRVKAGEVVSREEEKELSRQKALRAAQIKTLKEYGAKVFMPSIAIRCAENTRSSYETNLRKWIYPAMGDFKMPEITAAQISALLLSMQAQGKSHGTVIKVYTVLQAIFKMAFMSDIIEKNPMAKVERPRPRKGEVKEAAAEAYTAEEMRYILSCLGGLSSQVQHFIESNFVGSFPAQAFPWSEIKCSNEPADIIFCKCRYFASLWNKLTNQTVGILIGGSLPWRPRMCIEHINT